MREFLTVFKTASRMRGAPGRLRHCFTRGGGRQTPGQRSFERALNAARGELKMHQALKSWRLTAPLRAVRRTLE